MIEKDSSPSPLPQQKLQAIPEEEKKADIGKANNPKIRQRLEFEEEYFGDGSQL